MPEYRERHYPPTETLSLFLSQVMSADRSCQNIVNQAAVDRVIAGLPQAQISHQLAETPTLTLH